MEHESSDSDTSSSDDEMVFYMLQAANSFHSRRNNNLSIIRPVLDEVFEDRSHERVENYIERVVDKYTAIEFREHFRLSRASFEYILNKIAPIIKEKLTGYGRPPLEVDKTFLCALYTLANETPFRLASGTFDVSKSTAWNCVYRTAHALARYNESGDHGTIQWPDAERRNIIKEAFQKNNGLPGIIGAIDGCHIRIPQPKGNDALAYMNRKGVYSINLQGVCDHQCKFIDVYIGQVGSVHDATVFRRSDLYDKMVNSLLGLSPEEHIVGDLAYPLMSNLLVGFKDNGHMTRNQAKFNTKLSSRRVVIERAFGLLKGRFRRLIMKLPMRKLDEIPNIIFACCILHNICITLNDYDWVKEVEPPAAQVAQAMGPNQAVDNRNRQAAVAKRDHLVSTYCR